MASDIPLRETPYQPSTMENIDQAIYDWLNNIIDIYSTTNKGWEKVPAVWVTPERARQMKRDKGVRDAEGALILPVMAMQRTAVIKDPANKGIYQAHIPEVEDYRGGAITVSRQINQDKTSKFANADANRARKPPRGGVNFQTRGKNTSKIVYDTITMPLPIYLTMTYEIDVRTEYQEQMNEILTPFTTKTGGVNHFIIKRYIIIIKIFS